MVIKAETAIQLYRSPKSSSVNLTCMIGAFLENWHYHQHRGTIYSTSITSANKERAIEHHTEQIKIIIDWSEVEKTTMHCLVKGIQTDNNPFLLWMDHELICVYISAACKYRNFRCCSSLLYECIPQKYAQFFCVVLLWSWFWSIVMHGI